MILFNVRQVCQTASFGRSFFERLVLLGHEKHLLNIQYRTHPSISIFPNVKFYGGQIMDLKMLRPQVMKGVILKERCVDPYSFIYVCNNENEGVDAKLSKKTWQR